jgi:hypothetical protein
MTNKTLEFLGGPSNWPSCRIEYRSWSGGPGPDETSVTIDAASSGQPDVPRLASLLELFVQLDFLAIAETVNQLGPLAPSPAAESISLTNQAGQTVEAVLFYKQTDQRFEELRQRLITPPPSLEQARLEDFPQAPPYKGAPYTCPACGTETELWTGTIARLEEAKRTLPSFAPFAAELDTRAYCHKCRFSLGRIAQKVFRSIVCLRNDPEDETFGTSVLLVLKHPKLSKPEVLAIEFHLLASLAKTLRGDFDEYLLDPREDDLFYSGMVPGEGGLKVKTWYRALRERMGFVAASQASDPAKEEQERALLTWMHQQHSPRVEPRLLDFGVVQFDKIARRVLKLINPEDKKVLFTIHGVLGSVQPEQQELPAILETFPYKYDFRGLNLKEPWYQQPGEFLVQPYSEIELPIVVDIHRDTPGSNNELQIRISYPPHGEIAHRVQVRIVHQGPAGWSFATEDE